MFILFIKKVIVQHGGTHFKKQRQEDVTVNSRPAKAT